MDNTSIYKLKKPAQSDYYNIDDMNSNMDVLDEALKSLSDGKYDASKVSTVGAAIAGAADKAAARSAAGSGVALWSGSWSDGAISPSADIVKYRAIMLLTNGGVGIFCSINGGMVYGEGGFSAGAATYRYTFKCSIVPETGVMYSPYMNQMEISPGAYPGVMAPISIMAIFGIA